MSTGITNTEGNAHNWTYEAYKLSGELISFLNTASARGQARVEVSHQHSGPPVESVA